MPYCDTGSLNQHLADIPTVDDPGVHAVLIVDRAGWHITPKLVVPANITLLFLSPRAPELNPEENVWQFMRDDRLLNPISNDFDDIVALCCEA